MVLAFHCIFSTYGFWLPNDPRGSGSDYVAQPDLRRFGPATKTESRRSVAASPHDHVQRLAAKKSLRFPPVELTGRQALAVVKGFANACGEGEYRVYACAVLPNHVQLVIGRHDRSIRRIVGHLKSRATSQLKVEGLWADQQGPVWGDHGWNVFLMDRPAVERAIKYVENNPEKDGKRPQRWSIVTPFE
ncbi:MAG TPA: transposase [Pirellulales bacterium]